MVHLYYLQKRNDVYEYKCLDYFIASLGHTDALFNLILFNLTVQISL